MKQLKKLQKPLLICGILIFVIYVAADILAALQWKDYVYANQSISELFAVESPVRPFIFPFFLIVNVLTILFGLGIWMTDTPKKRAKRIVSIMLITNGIIGFITLVFFPMHLREFIVSDGRTINETAHLILTSIGVLSIFIAIGFGSILRGRWFCIYSIVTILVLLVFGILAGRQAPQLEAGMITPLMGIFERINSYGSELWMAVLAMSFLRAENESKQT